MKSIVIYFSRKGQNYFGGAIKDLKKGNTEIVAEYIQEAVGGDIFEVEPLKEYSRDYYACTDEAKKELRAGERPQLKNYPSDLQSYDVIFVGYPNWWGTMPMAMFTLLEKCDLQGKIIAPFCTNEGSGIGNSVADLKNICKGADIKEGLAIIGSQAVNSQKKVADWAKFIIR